MVSSLNVCDELQDLYVNCLMSSFIKGGFFFYWLFSLYCTCCHQSFFDLFFCVLSASSAFFTGFSKLRRSRNERSTCIRPSTVVLQSF